MKVIYEQQPHTLIHYTHAQLRIKKIYKRLVWSSWSFNEKAVHALPPGSGYIPQKKAH